jgi:hypothetical protein
LKLKVFLFLRLPRLLIYAVGLSLSETDRQTASSLFLLVLLSDRHRVLLSNAQQPATQTD